MLVPSLYTSLGGEIKYRLQPPERAGCNGASSPPALWALRFHSTVSGGRREGWRRESEHKRLGITKEAAKARPSQKTQNLRLTYRPTLSSRTEYALFRTAGHMRLVDPSTSDDKAFLEFGGKIQMTPDIAAADSLKTTTLPFSIDFPASF